MFNTILDAIIDWCLKGADNLPFWVLTVFTLLLLPILIPVGIVGYIWGAFSK